jgi:heptose I phosphotransferase
MTRTLHRHGINHRDLYICHFLLKQPWAGSKADLHLHLIDLHRVQQHKKLPFRWQVKDLGSLYFSSMETGLSRRDLLRFLRTYFDQPLREIFEQHQGLLQATEKRAQALWAKGNRG